MPIVENMETVIVLLIVVGAAVYVGRVFYRGFTREESCACGCSGCPVADSCTPPPKTSQGDQKPEKNL